MALDVVVALVLSLILILVAISVIRQLTAPVKLRIRVQVGAFQEVAKRATARTGIAPVTVRKAPDGTSALFDETIHVNVQHPEAPSDKNGEESVGMKATSFLAASADASIGIWEKWTSIDDHVFKAVAHLVDDKVTNLFDLAKVVQAKNYPIESEGFFNHLKGHVGEWNVIDHFKQAVGADGVSVPPISNEAGTDLWVGENALDVKTSADPTQLIDNHFASYPDIPVVIPHDAVNIPDGALHFDPSAGFDPTSLHGDYLVVVDDALSNADVVDQTQHAIDVLQDPGSVIHIPVITMAVSGIREGRLLLKGHTDLQRATKNILIDTASVGGGGAIGGVIGSFIGSLIGDDGGEIISEMIGGAIGAVGGAFAGKFGANKLKRKPLKDAQERYTAARGTYQEVEKSTLAYVRSEWVTTRATEQKRLRDALVQLRSRFDAQANQTREHLHGDLTLGKIEMNALIAAARNKVEGLVRDADSRFRESTPGFRRLSPGLFAPEAAAQLFRLKKDAKRWGKAARVMSEKWVATPEFTSKVFDLLLAVPEFESEAERFVEKALTSRMQRYAILKGTYDDLLAVGLVLRKTAADNLRSAWETTVTVAESKMVPALQALKRAGETLTLELRKAGVEI